MACHRRTILGLVVLCATAFVNAEEPRIVGGSQAAQSEFPYIASIRHYGSHFCGGTIISNRHILTAAHCFEGRIFPPYAGITVVTGATSLMFGGESHTIINAVRHAGFSGDPATNIPNDVAVLTLAQPINFNSQQQPISLASGQVPENTIGVVAGWGYQSAVTTALSPQLKKMHTQIISPRTCMQYIGGQMYLQQICGKQIAVQGVCSGDSGGPLVANGQVIGIVSWVASSCGTGLPDVYTSVYMYRDFIQQNMRLY